MKWFLYQGAALLIGMAAWAEEPAESLKFGEREFRFQLGYTLELVAGPPLVERPIEASLDDKGRLYVTESSGSNDPVEVQQTAKPHRVLRLTDEDGDGIYDTRTVFAEGLMFPEGCLWKDGSLYVAAVPEILKFTDEDGDGVAERREVWFDGKTTTGCANDLHGPYAGPDGWIYWCKGAFAEQTYSLPGQPEWTTRAAHVFRSRADGSGLEPVFTAGMDNPVGLAWTPEGELIVAGTFFQEPAGGQRDGLIHAVYGGVWGKDHDVLQGHPRTGTLLPPMTHLGPAAPCGITRYGRDLLVCQFNLRQISRHQMQPQGASYQTTDETFLSCDHPDFHPTDVLQAADGSVLVVDTGGWYKLCCPTSQIAKPEVLGAIYRLRKTDGEISPACPTPQWSAGDPADMAQQIKNLSAADLHVRRRAAEALGRSHAVGAVPAILQSLAASEPDRFLFHALTYALLQMQDPAATRAAFQQENATVLAAALYALEQMPGGQLTASETLPRLGSRDERLRDAAFFVLNRHRDWASEIQTWLEAARPAESIETLSRVVKNFATESWVQAWLSEALTQADQPEQSPKLLRLMAEMSLDELPDAWAPPLSKILRQDSAAHQLAALNVLASARPRHQAELQTLLREFAADAGKSSALRRAALVAQPNPELEDAAFEFVLAQIKSHTSDVATLLTGKSLTFPQLRQVAPLIPEIGILERPMLAKLFAECHDEEVGAALVQALKIENVGTSIPQEILQEATAGFSDHLRQELATAVSPPAPAEQSARLEELEKTLPEGEVARGVMLFQSVRTACSTCHPVGYKGGHLGPDLSKVGAIRTRRDLLEAIAFPSASFVRSFEPMLVTLNNGTVTYGIISNQNAESLTLNTNPLLPATHVLRSEIKSIAPGSFSLMPQGLDRALSPAELADIVAYLQSLK